MTKKIEFTNPFAEMFGEFPVDMSAFNDLFKSTANFSEKFTNVALAAAEKNVEISNKWTKEALGKLSNVAKVQDDPADYAKVATDFASTAAETASEQAAAFAEVAKKVQMDTVELMLAAGKDAQAEATAAVKKATTEATAAVKKAAAKAA